MKLILVGSTGFVGHEVLSQCLQHPAITSIVALSRRDLPAHEKLQVTIVEDFLNYPDSIRERIKDADACIWTLGKARILDNDEARRVSLDYTMTAAQVFQKTCQKPFRFIYCSGAAVERDQTKPLWFMQDYRRIRGQVETAMLKYADDHPGFGTYIMRPAMILTRLMSLRNLLFSFGPSVKVDELSRTMLDLALNGAQKNIWENADMKQQHVS